MIDDAKVERERKQKRRENIKYSYKFAVNTHVGKQGAKQHNKVAVNVFTAGRKDINLLLVS